MVNQDKKNLKNIFGFDDYKNNQQEIIKEVLEGKNILTVMPTGGGKSLCYQLPATLFDGLTLVVSPLIALMQSQVAQLQLLGIKAYCLNSSNSDVDNKEIIAMIKSNEVTLLYIAPERLIKNETIDLLKTKKISLLAIDEAHCVSQWGHDFRKEYLQLGKIRKELSMVQTIALTATADETTRKDIIDKIFPKRPSVFIAGFDRPNIYLSMLPKNKAKEQILSFIKPFKGQTGIIYCSTRKKTEEWSKYLKEHSFKALPYHAGMTVENRKKNLEAFIQEEGIVITAIILAAITGASFLLWVIPQDNDTTFIVTDYEEYLDGAKNIHEVLEESIDIEYNNLREGKIAPMDYIAITEITSSQVTTQISEFITSKPSEQWQESYISYMNAMKKFNEYILETKVLANQIENGSIEEEIQQTVNKIDSIKAESIEYIIKSNDLRP